MPARQPSSNGRKISHDKATKPGTDASPDGPDASDAADDPAGSQPADAVAGVANAAAPEVAAEIAADDVPMNRAARRAKGKGAALPRPVGKIVPGRTNLTHGPRSYANRRSG
jgi:hypothetical protein